MNDSHKNTWNLPIIVHSRTDYRGLQTVFLVMNGVTYTSILWMDYT